MGNPDKKGPDDIIHLYFDDYENEEPPVSKEIVDELQAEMAAINRKLKRKKKKK